jgi:hypothetical protein
MFADPLQMSHACHRFCKCHRTFTFRFFGKVQSPLRLPGEMTLQHRKMGTCGVLHFASKCVSHDKALQISTSDFQKWPETASFSHF